MERGTAKECSGVAPRRDGGGVLHDWRHGPRVQSLIALLSLTRVPNRLQHQRPGSAGVPRAAAERLWAQLCAWRFSRTREQLLVTTGEHPGLGRGQPKRGPTGKLLGRSPAPGWRPKAVRPCNRSAAPPPLPSRRRRRPAAAHPGRCLRLLARGCPVHPVSTLVLPPARLQVPRSASEHLAARQP